MAVGTTSKPKQRKQAEGAKPQQRAPEGFVMVSIAIHREVRREMNVAAAAAEIDIYKMHHRLLCKALGRDDLIEAATA